MVRQAQFSVMQKMEKVWTIASADLPVSDVMHNSSLADRSIAVRCADCALEMLYGKPRIWKGPFPVKALGDEDSVRIYFQGVSHWLELYDLEPESLPIEAEDAQGFLPLESYRTQTTEEECWLEMRFARRRKGETRVHGAWRAFP